MNEKRNYAISAALAGTVTLAAALSFLIYNKLEFDRKNIPFKIKNPSTRGVIPSTTGVIPLNMFVTWHTKDLPPLMKLNYEQLQKDNPEFKHHLYDDAECREFIKTNYDSDVLDAFDKLIPGAYKADLWRYCVLYKLGGVYLDIKFKCINGFKFITVTDKEYFVRDRISSGHGIYNAIMICKANNPILLKAINRVVKNTQTNFYGKSFLHPTGPMMLKSIMDETTIDNIEMYMDLITYPRTYIVFGDAYILTHYAEYRQEQKKFQKKSYHPYLWCKRQIYKHAQEN
jgi:mannosyltransferase OCH1-like enzyme